MTLNEVLGLAIAIGLPSVGGLVSYGMLRQTVTGQAAELAELKGRVEKAEDTATKVGGLASAVEGMGQRFADQIKHLVDVMDLHNGHTRDQLARIEAELGHVKNNAAMAKELATRRRRADADA